jgi:L-arabinokinase
VITPACASARSWAIASWPTSRHGYLANVGTETFHEFEAHIPNTLQGSVFLKRYGGTTDPVTRIDPDRCYAVWTPTAHPIYEHERVTEWARILRQPGQPGQPDPPDQPEIRDWLRLGELMYQSHSSYSKCGLGSDGTDLLVELAKAAGPKEGVYGAKITGGGSGGTVAILAAASAADRVRRIAAEYADRTGRTPYFFEGSSDGAAIRTRNS